MIQPFNGVFLDHNGYLTNFMKQLINKRTGSLLTVTNITRDVKLDHIQIKQTPDKRSLSTIQTKCINFGETYRYIAVVIMSRCLK